MGEREKEREREGEGEVKESESQLFPGNSLYTLHSLVHTSNMLELTESSLHLVGKTMRYLVHPRILERTITGPEVLNLERLFLRVW